MRTYRVVYEQIEVREYTIQARSKAEALKLAEEPWKLNREQSSYPGEFVAVRDYELVDMEQVQ
jgi:hypothetical protein